MVNVHDCIIYDYNEIQNNEGADVAQIVAHTANTWQATRGTDEKSRDTKQGKHAEQAVSLFFSKCDTSVKYISYDSFRADNFEKHAPFDGVLVDISKVDNETILDVFAKINREIERGNYGSISPKLRKEMFAAGGFSVEVKSTKVSDKKRNNAGFVSYDDGMQIKNLIDSLCCDDFLTYPHYLREGEFEWEEYCLYVKKRNFKLSSLSGCDLQNAVKEIELENMDDFYIRVYMDEIHKKVLILGYISKEDLMNPPYLKKMPKFNKSENPIYLAKSLHVRKPLGDLISLIEK